MRFRPNWTLSIPKPKSQLHPESGHYGPRPIHWTTSSRQPITNTMIVSSRRTGIPSISMTGMIDSSDRGSCELTPTD